MRVPLIRSVFAASVVAAVAAGPFSTNPAEASYSGESGLVAYTADSEVFVMNPDGSAQRQVTLGGGQFIKREVVCAPDEPVDVYTSNSSPRWMPDRDRVAFLHHGVDDRMRIRAVNPDGTGLVTLLTDWHGTMISWSPDGASIAYGDERGIWVARADGRNPRLVAPPSEGQWPAEPGHPSEIFDVKWSPDGARLAFLEEAGGGGCAAGTTYVSVIDVNGTNRRPELCYGWSGAMDWSPDGSRLVCGVDDDDMPWPSLAMVALDGTRELVTPSGCSAAWSPDGRTILFDEAPSWDESTRRDLYSFEVGSGTTALVAAGFAGTGLDWQAVPPLPDYVERLAGLDRYGTAVAVSREVFGDPAVVDAVFVATGANFPDALSAAAAAGHVGSPVLLVGATVPGSVKAELERLDPDTIYIVGGPAVISNFVAAKL